MRLLDDVDDAKDAVQEALVATMVRSGVNDVYNYCQWVLRNKCIDMLRYRNKKRALDEGAFCSDPYTEELLKLVADKKAELEPEARQVLELHYEDGLTLAKVAEQMKMSVSSVKRLLAVAKESLKHKIELER